MRALIERRPGIVLAGLALVILVAGATACTAPHDPNDTTTTASTTTTTAPTTTVPPTVATIPEQTTTSAEETTTTLARSLSPRFNGLAGFVRVFPTDAAAIAFDPDPYQTLTGSGNQVVKIGAHPGAPVLLHIMGNTAAQHFVVKSFDPGGQPTYTLVDTIDKYDGYVLLDWRVGEASNRLQVEGTGDWIIEVKPFSQMRSVTGSGTVAGNGDDVIALDGIVTGLTAKGNDIGAYFGIHFIDPVGGGSSDPIATIQPYDGEVVIPGAGILLIEAIGPWELNVEGFVFSPELILPIRPLITIPLFD